ncbi:MAG TPA: MEDS domain-containing protein [Acidimicrobiales bacterium]|nr:MEDS domain-containing protein [Acidimicrobiales bacterium]
MVQFYERDERFVEYVVDYLYLALQRGDAVIVLATEPHLGVIAVRLQGLGVDIGALQSGGQFRAMDAMATLQAIMSGGRADAGLFDAVVGAAVRRAGAGGRPVFAFGEMVALLWSTGQLNTALELEQLWDGLRARVPFTLLCSYSTQAPGGGVGLDDLDQLCHLHSDIVGGRPADVAAGSLGGASQLFARTEDAPRAARHFVVGTLLEWAAGQVIDDAALVVTELATNAVLHARSDFRVVIAAAPGSVRVSVSDQSSAAPDGRDFSLSGSSGRGLGLVAALSRRWGTTHVHDGGKVVWAELAR